jgi:glycosyltransferase involved in cell wall biosynthesis
MTAMPRPIVGFFGLIERWIDLDLVDFLAERRPQWTFVLIGRLAVPAESLKSRANVHFPGKRAFDDLPAYGKQFDAAIIPYHLNQQVMHANPLKLREYLAMGKPTVSVRTPEIEKYADVVEIADSYEEFLTKLDAILAHRDPPTEVQRRMNRVATESWDARLTEVFEIVRDCLRRVENPIEQPVEIHSH